MPFFSVIMPCYNCADTLQGAIASVLEQDFTNWELICVNDGSSDATAQMLDAISTTDTRIRVIHIENRGPAVARNFGAAQAHGRILSFLDADDLWEISKLSELYRVFQDPGVGGAFGEISFFTTEGRETTRSHVPSQALTIPDLMAENPVCTMSNLSLRKSLFVLHGGLAQGFVHNEDLEWLIRLVGLGVTIQPIPSRQVWYRKSEGGLSADLEAMAQSRRKALDTARYFGFSPSPAQEAIYDRYLARRALRLQDGNASAKRYALRGMRRSPRAFLNPPRRGLVTALAAVAAPTLPKALKRALFA